MRSQRSLSLLSIIFFSVLLVKCGKDGAPGPQGPVGPTGPTGAAGTNGTTGAKGATGTANVIYSDWYIPSSYVLNTGRSPVHLDANIAASAITQSVLNNGSVIVYGKLDGYPTSVWPSNQVSNLPISVVFDAAGKTLIDTWSAIITPGNIEIDFVEYPGYNVGIVNAHQFRYIIIPGGVKTLGNIDPNNYNEVKHALQLPD